MVNCWVWPAARVKLLGVTVMVMPAGALVVTFQVRPTTALTVRVQLHEVAQL